VLEKLKLIENRFSELGELIIQPDIISDQKKYIQISKEYKDTKKIIDKGEIYRNLLSNKSEAQDIISVEKDDEMIEMAKMQLEEVENELPKIEEELKVLLIPKDPDDSKNVVVDASRSCFVPRLLLSDHEPHFPATSIDLEISSDSGTISSRAPCSRAFSELQT